MVGVGSEVIRWYRHRTQSLSYVYRSRDLNVEGFELFRAERG